MKRTLGLLALLLALVAAYFLFFYEAAPDNIFHVDVTTRIGVVELQTIAKGEAKDKLRLERQENNSWSVNGTYTAIQAKVDDFLTLLTQIRVVNKLEEKGQQSALSLLKRNHTRIDILDRDGGELKSYLVGATAQQQTANIMMISGADQAYVVARPGSEGYVSIYYNTELNNWREKLLFAVEGTDLREVRTEYLDSLSNFQLRRTGADAPWTIGEGVYADEERVNGYLDLFAGKVFAESFVGEQFPGLRDSLERRTPDAKFSFVTLDGKSKALKLFARPENPNNFFGFVQGGSELYTVQHFVVDKFLKTGDYFQKSGI
ncbi:MAG: DUF4340 domain-containing protein [Bacteroidota bacterium]